MLSPQGPDPRGTGLGLGVRDEESLSIRNKLGVGYTCSPEPACRARPTAWRGQSLPPQGAPGSEPLPGHSSPGHGAPSRIAGVSAHGVSPAPGLSCSRSPSLLPRFIPVALPTAFPSPGGPTLVSAGPSAPGTPAVRVLLPFALGRSSCTWKVLVGGGIPHMSRVHCMGESRGGLACPCRQGGGGGGVGMGC